MTEQEMRWFENINKVRMGGAHFFNMPFMSGVQNSIVDKYSDQAHFIYELLQNANDAKATSARFRLQKNGLFFIHNGSVRFTVSDPYTEDADKKAGSLGHVNSITSVGNSNKSVAAIGKFGVGFKAVFQYTQTPHIYDPKFRFKIERLFVPHLLDDDLDWRSASETVFWFPFDGKDMTPSECSDDILEKLKSLDMPMLFLSHLQRVEFDAHEISGYYAKIIGTTQKQGDIVLQQVECVFDLAGSKAIQHLLIFTRNTSNNLPYSIGYALG